jgi:predicted DNA-binding ribbon-helix-helix protein
MWYWEGLSANRICFEDVMSHQPSFTLPEPLYLALRQRARQQGMTMMQLLASLVAEAPEATEPTLAARLQGLIGVIDSRAEPQYPSAKRSPFGQIWAADLEQQGLRRP